MSISVLITQCLQRDFVDPVHPYDPLPNRLHIGHAEALRLIGPDPGAGPLAQLMTWARSQPRESLEVIHIRDWHDDADPRQRDHLAMFGPHCIRGTRGAELVFGLADPGDRAPNEQVVDAVALNDFEGTTLGGLLADLGRRAGDAPHGGGPFAGGPVRVGVVGVWTEAKVSFLLYDLKTRLGIDELATCSALTASASRAQHRNALEQLARILGVRVFDSVGEFVAWLRPGAALALPAAKARFGPRVDVACGKTILSEDDRDIVGYLYRDSSRIALEPLSGGFSGALVFKASSRDALGHEQAPSVVKLGGQRAIAQERVAFERVEEILGNNAPSVRGFVELGQRAGIKYSYAAMGQGRVSTLKALFEAGARQGKIDALLRSVFDEILGPLYAAARYEKLPILEHYGFAGSWAAKVRESVTKLVGEERAAAQELVWPGEYRAGNVCAFYERFLPALPAASDFHYVSLVHGDLNGANILVDGRENVWVIDFFHTGAGHVLKDLAKLENDILYIMTPIGSREDLAEALLLTRALREVADLRQPLPEELPGLRSPGLLRAWSSIRTLREIAGRLCREDRHPFQMDAALLRFAIHTLGFDESSPLQKEWALAAACGFADDIVATTRADAVLRVDWLEAPVLGRGRIGMTICPGRRDRGRDVAADLGAIRAQGGSRLVCLVSDDELEWAGVPRLGEAARAAGLAWKHVPVPDQGAPGAQDAAALAAFCLAATDAGESVVLHCLGGLGRTGTIAACALASRGVPAPEAIAMVRRARGPRAIETREQERFVTAFAEQCGAARP